MLAKRVLTRFHGFEHEDGATSVAFARTGNRTITWSDQSERQTHTHTECERAAYVATLSGKSNFSRLATLWSAATVGVGALARRGNEGRASVTVPRELQTSTWPCSAPWCVVPPWTGRHHRHFERVCAIGLAGVTALSL